MRKIARGLVFAVFILMLIPIRIQLNDGGTKIYRSILGVYEIEKLNRLGNVGKTLTITEGVSMKLFGTEVYSDTKGRFAVQYDWQGKNGATHFNAVVTEITEDMVIAESTKNLVGPIEAGTPVSFGMNVVHANGMPEIEVGDEIRVMYNDKHVVVEEPLYLGVVFAVWKLDESGNIIVNRAELEEDMLSVISSSSVVEEVRTGSDKNVLGEWVQLDKDKNVISWTGEQQLQNYTAELSAEELLEKVTDAGFVVIEEGNLCSGVKEWQKFCEESQMPDGTMTSVNLAYCDNSGEEVTIRLFGLLYFEDRFWLAYEKGEVYEIECLGTELDFDLMLADYIDKD